MYPGSYPGLLFLRVVLFAPPRLTLLTVASFVGRAFLTVPDQKFSPCFPINVGVSAGTATAICFLIPSVSAAAGYSSFRSPLFDQLSPFIRIDFRWIPDYILQLTHDPHTYHFDTWVYRDLGLGVFLLLFIVYGRIVECTVRLGSRFERRHFGKVF